MPQSSAPIPAASPPPSARGVVAAEDGLEEREVEEGDVHDEEQRHLHVHRVLLPQEVPRELEDAQAEHHLRHAVVQEVLARHRLRCITPPIAMRTTPCTVLVTVTTSVRNRKARHDRGSEEEGELLADVRLLTVSRPSRSGGGRSPSRTTRRARASCSYATSTAGTTGSSAPAPAAAPRSPRAGARPPSELRPRRRSDHLRRAGHAQRAPALLAGEPRLIAPMQASRANAEGRGEGRRRSLLQLQHLSSVARSTRDRSQRRARESRRHHASRPSHPPEPPTHTLRARTHHMYHVPPPGHQNSAERHCRIASGAFCADETHRLSAARVARAALLSHAAARVSQLSTKWLATSSPPKSAAAREHAQEADGRALPPGVGGHPLGPARDDPRRGVRGGGQVEGALRDVAVTALRRSSPASRRCARRRSRTPRRRAATRSRRTT